MLCFLYFYFRNPSWWRRRTALERALTLISIVCLLAVVALVVSLIVVIVNEQINKKGKLFETYTHSSQTNFCFHNKLANNESKAEALDGSNIQQVTDGSGTGTNNVISNNDKGSKSNGYENLCLTPGCVHSASNMLDQMDKNVEPCDDFYSFACGNFVKETIIPDEKVSVNTFSIIGDKLQEQLRTLVTDPILENDPEPFKLAKNLYKACINKSTCG